MADADVRSTLRMNGAPPMMVLSRNLAEIDPSSGTTQVDNLDTVS